MLLKNSGSCLLLTKRFGSALEIGCLHTIGKQDVCQCDIGIDQCLNTVFKGCQQIGIERNQNIVQTAGKYGTGTINNRIFGEKS